MYQNLLLQPLKASQENQEEEGRGSHFELQTMAAAKEIIQGASIAVVLSELGSIITLKEELKRMALKASLGGQYVCALRS